MVRLAQEARLLNNPPPFPLNIDETNHVMAFHRGGLLFVFNWSGDRAIMDYMLPVPQKGEWRVVLDTDNARFGGFGRQDVSMPHFTDGDGNLSLYLVPPSWPATRGGRISVQFQKRAVYLSVCERERSAGLRTERGMDMRFYSRKVSGRQAVTTAREVPARGALLNSPFSGGWSGCLF